MTAVVLQWENTRRMQVGIDIGNKSDRYHLTRGMLVDIDIGNDSDSYRLRVGGYSGDTVRYCY